MLDLTQLKEKYGFILVRHRGRAWRLNGTAMGKWLITDPTGEKYGKITTAMSCEWCKDEKEYIKATGGYHE